MANLLKAQVYKLFHSGFFYIILIINITVNSLGIYLDHLRPITPHKGYEYIYYLLRNGVQFFEIIGVTFVVIFVASEFKDGNICSEISYGHKRISIYFSKLISSMFGLTIILISTMLTGLTVGTLIAGLGSPINSEIIVNLIKTSMMIIFVSFSLCSIYVFLSFVIRNSGVIVALYAGVYVLVLTMVSAQLSMRFKLVLKLVECFPDVQLTNIATLKITNWMACEAIVYTVVVLIITTLLGCTLFNKADIA